ncbi:glycosyl hydrolase [Bacteroidota bacterium]
MKKKYLVFALIIIIFVSSSFAQKKDKDKNDDNPLSGLNLSGLKLRSLGPALMSGRVSDFAVNPDNPSEYYVAVASGNLWKTINSGTTWTPVFDNEKSYSIGCVTIDPNNHNVVWVGSGENNSQRSVSWGDGVYMTSDGGKSWKNMGLKNSEHIGKIIVHPKNSNIVYVAAQGPLWNPGGDRGLYKTTDGGKSWNLILDISENTGVTDIVMAPRDPDVIIAASYQRRRHVYTLINGGPESAIYKTTDGGQNWSKITSGIPSVDIGRIGLAMSPVNPDYVYAIIEAANGQSGFFRSIDRGESWEKMNGYKTVSPQYYNEIVCDPKNVDKVYSLDTRTKFTIDGGKTWKNLGNKSRHVDDHALWIDPTNTKHLLIGGDGGVYESFDLGQNWAFKSNLPITQFYRVGIDNAEPFYNLYGGTQDNATIGGPSRTINRAGIVNSDWFITVFGDGFETQVDPKDPNIIYSQSQYGWLSRYDKKSGEKISIKPQPREDEKPHRWNWDSPLLISPHSNKRLYFAANVLFRSDDRGNYWNVISPDLTRQLDRNKLSVMGKIQSVDAVAKNASTSLYGNIISITESPLKENLLYVGTDDGLIQYSMDIGAEWKKYDKFPEVPETTYVSCVLASMHKTSTVYASFDNHKRGDFKPYILKSSNNGKKWNSIAGDLPHGEVIYTIAEDHINPNLLFIGTEYGVYFTINGGENWTKIKSGIPTIAVKDIEIQRRENDLVLATFGRGFYILDDYSPLRNLNNETLAKNAIIFPVKNSLMYIQAQPLGYGKKGSQGELYYTADNPPFGATFTYYFKEDIKTKKQNRKEAEKKAIEKGEAIKYPTNEEIYAEGKEEAPYLIFTILDSDKKIVRKLKAPASAGLQRIIWDFRYPSTKPLHLSSGKNTFANEGDGIMAIPGNYSVFMSKYVDGEITVLTDTIDFKAVPLKNTTLPADDRKDLVEFQKKVAELSRAVMGVDKISKDLQTKLKLMRVAIKSSPHADQQWLENVKFLEQKNEKIILALHGDKSIQERNENTPPTISDRIDNVLYGMWNSTSSPTATQKEQYLIAADEFGPLLSELKILLEIDLKILEEKLENIQSPYTPGRIPVWKK